MLVEDALCLTYESDRRSTQFNVTSDQRHSSIQALIFVRVSCCFLPVQHVSSNPSYQHCKGDKYYDLRPEILILSAYLTLIVLLPCCVFAWDPEICLQQGKCPYF